MKLLKKLQKKGKTKVVEVAANSLHVPPHISSSPSNRSEDEPLHLSLNLLNDDVLTTILAFVSYAPYQRSSWMAANAILHVNDGHHRLLQEYVAKNRNGKSPGRSAFPKRQQSSKKPQRKLFSHSFGTLTHVLPLVCRRFLHLACSDLLWSQAIRQMSLYDAVGWRMALKEYVTTDSAADLFGDLSGGRRADLVVEACAKFQSECSSDESSTNSGSTNKRLFQHLAERAECIVFYGPLFHSKNVAPPHIGSSCSLRLTDEIHKELIDTVIAGLEPSYMTGALISDIKDGRPRPRFLYSYGVELPLASGDPVLIAELSRCNVRGKGRVDITVIPLLHARLSSDWDNDPGKLVLARALPRVNIHLPCENHSRNAIEAPMIRTFSTVAPQLGMEFVIKDIGTARYSSMLLDMMGDELTPYLSGCVIPHTKALPRPTIIYTCQPDRWMPLGVGVPGEDAIVLLIRRCRQNPDGTFVVTGVPVQLGHIVRVNGALQGSNLTATIKIRVALKGLGPKLV